MRIFLIDPDKFPPYSETLKGDTDQQRDQLRKSFNYWHKKIWNEKGNTKVVAIKEGFLVILTSGCSGPFDHMVPEGILLDEELI